MHLLFYVEIIICLFGFYFVDTLSLHLLFNLNYITMKKLFYVLLFGTLCSFGFSQNITILGHLKVLAIDEHFIDIICEPPYDVVCFQVITEITVATKSSNSNNMLEVDSNPVVKVKKNWFESDGRSIDVYTVKKEDVDKGLILLNE